jgi:hypothetical protein
VKTIGRTCPESGHGFREGGRNIVANRGFVGVLLEIMENFFEMDENFTRYDTAMYLHAEEDMVLYLDACFEEDPGDGSLNRTALGGIARARGMSRLA